MGQANLKTYIFKPAMIVIMIWSLNELCQKRRWVLCQICIDQQYGKRSIDKLCCKHCIKYKGALLWPRRIPNWIYEIVYDTLEDEVDSYSYAWYSQSNYKANVHNPCHIVADWVRMNYLIILFNSINWLVLSVSWVSFIFTKTKQRAWEDWDATFFIDFLICEIFVHWVSHPIFNSIFILSLNLLTMLLRKLESEEHCFSLNFVNYEEGSY